MAEVKEERTVEQKTTTPELEFSVIFPRRKTVNANGKGEDGEPVFVTREFLTPYFKKPMMTACAELGVCPTAMKKACRKLGIVKWPYRQTVAASRNTKVGTLSSAASPQARQQPSGNQPSQQQQQQLLLQQRQQQMHLLQLHQHQQQPQQHMQQPMQQREMVQQQEIQHQLQQLQLRLQQQQVQQQQQQQQQMQMQQVHFFLYVYV
jgi:hypothetical protein